MELVEVTADNLSALVERWYALAKTMEDYSELNELVYADIGEVPDDEFRSHFDLLREIADRNTVGKDSNDSLYIPPRRWSRVFSRYGGLILWRIAAWLGYDPPKEDLLDLLLAAAVDPNLHRRSLIEDIQHSAFVRELA